MLRKILICLLLLACESGQGLPVVDAGSASTPDEVSVCHSPSSPEHGKLCSDQCFIYSQDNPYCWKLIREDCKGDLFLDWQLENCHFFE